MRPGVKSLAVIPLFRSFDAARMEALNQVADLARVGPDEVIFREGDRLEELNVLLTGFVTETHAQPGRNSLTDVVAPVTPIGFAPAMLGTASPTGAQTITSARLIVIPAAELRAMIHADPGLALPFLDHALVALREQTLELCHMKLRSVAQRLAAFMLRLAEDTDVRPARFVLPYEKRFLAAKIGCTQENLSRAFAALRPLGVESQRGAVVISDVEALRTFARLPPATPDASGPG